MRYIFIICIQINCMSSARILSAILSRTSAVVETFLFICGFDSLVPIRPL